MSRGALLIAVWVSLGGRMVCASDPPVPQVSASMPSDVMLPSGQAPTEDAIAFFDDFSWREFIAISWPANDCGRGRPALHGVLGDRRRLATWDTWKRDYELFLSQGQRPTPWNSWSVSECLFNRHHAFVLSPYRKPLGVVGHDSLGRRISGFNQAGVDTPVGGLVDQDGRYVVYEILFNETAFQFIRGADCDGTSWRYLARNLPPRGDAPLVFPAGSVVIKAAWRQFPIPADRRVLSRYYTRMADVIDPSSGKSATVCAGLIGLHIAHRTPANPEWIWSTFEHIDTVTAENGRRPILNDPDGSQNPNDPANNLPTPVVDDLNAPLICPTRTQVVRIRRIHDSTASTNSLYRSQPLVAASVLRFYQLVMTQWATEPAADDDQFQARFNGMFPGAMGLPFPSDGMSPTATSITNVTMETLRAFQRQNSCMNCHHTPLRKSSATGVSWTLAKRAFPAKARD